MPNEEFALVLDYLPSGRSSAFKPEPLAQVIGTTYFTLLEVIPKKNLQILEKVYIGKEQREQVDRIKRRVEYKDLTNTAQQELEHAIESIIQETPQKYLDFFNKAGSISIKRHQLELIPGLGKKHVFDILEKRQQKPFESFEDLEQRVHLMPNAMQSIAKRIMEELQGLDPKHYLFARPPAPPEEQRFDRRPFKRF